MKTKDNVIPTSKRSFSEEVTKCFGDMLSRSIPDYETMRSLTEMLGFSFVQKDKDILDIGCSSGLAVEPFIKKIGPDSRFILLDESPSMIAECKDKYRNGIEQGFITVKQHNISDGLPECNACLVLSVLTIQFTPIEHRQKILSDIYNALDDGGALIFVEKVLGDTNATNQLMVDNYYAIKRNNGYSDEQIYSKKKSLEGVLVPVTAEANESFLRKAGFKYVDCFWRCLNFCGWLAVK